ncbi:MAG: protein-methionine-sulfoxide reductase heme-binding subunit MsrQ [Methyloglobulus sp.]
MSSNGLNPLVAHLSNYDWELLLQNFLKLRNLCITASLIPLCWIFIDILFDNLGANPIQALHIRLGDWALRFLCITLAITPIQKITKWRGMANYRQLFGLYAFFYATLHLLAYLLIDHALVWPVIVTDVVESSYIWFGLLAYIVIFLLAITSPKSAKKMMGKSWKKLHRFIYPASVAVIIHYFWQLKGNLLQPVFYTILVILLLAFRVAVWLKNRQFNRLMIPKSRPIDDD